jgi:hypothetical protein
LSRTRLVRFGLALSLLLTILVVYWRVFSYSFIYDDWALLRSVKFDDTATYFKNAFFPQGVVLYRPIGLSYFYLMYSLFKLNPLGFHLASLMIHLVNSIFVVAIVKKILQDEFTAWIVGFLYAAAVTIHMEPLLWLAGFYDLGGALFFFSSILLFVHRRYVPSALIYLAGLMAKESVMALPIIVLMIVPFLEGSYQLSFGSLRNLLSKLWLHFLILSFYLIAKAVEQSPIAVPGDYPFRVELMGPHIGIHLVKYATWALLTLLPWKEAGDAEWVLFLAMVGFFASIVLLELVRLPTRAAELEVKMQRNMLLWTTWVIGGLLPVFFLKQHVAKYFLIYSLPAFVVLFILGLRMILRSCRVRVSVINLIVLILSLSSVVSSSYYLPVKIEAGKYIDGTFNLLKKAELTEQVETFLLKEYPVIRPGASLVFWGVETRSFAFAAGPQVWYNDSTLRVSQTNRVGRDSLGIYVNVEQARSPEKMYIDTSKTYLFLLIHREMRRYDFSKVKPDWEQE